MRHINAFTYRDNAEKFVEEMSPAGDDEKLEVVSVGDPFGPGLMETHSLYIVFPTAIVDKMLQELSDWRDRHKDAENVTPTK